MPWQADVSNHHVVVVLAAFMEDFSRSTGIASTAIVQVSIPRPVNVVGDGISPIAPT